jgi:hypothetical protein
MGFISFNNLLLPIQQQDFGPCQGVKTLKCIKGITRQQPLAVLFTMALSLLADYGIYQFQHLG